MGTMGRFMGSIHSRNVLMNNAPTSSGTVRLYTHSKWTCHADSPAEQESYLYILPGQGFSKRNWETCCECGGSFRCHLTKRQTVKTKLGLALLSETLIIGLSRTDMLQRYVWTLWFLFLNNVITVVSSKYNFSAFSTSADRTVATAGLDESKQSSKIASSCVGWLFTGENPMLESSAPSFWACQVHPFSASVGRFGEGPGERLLPCPWYRRLSDCPVDGARAISWLPIGEQKRCLWSGCRPYGFIRERPFSLSFVRERGW